MRRKAILLISILLAANNTVAKDTFPLEEVEVSMHMVLPVKSEGRYYITGTTDLINVWKGKTKGFTVYSSKDLKSWGKQLAWPPSFGVSIEEGHPEFIPLRETRDDIFLDRNVSKAGK